jgi:hypothetical protein
MFYVLICLIGEVYASAVLVVHNYMVVSLVPQVQREMREYKGYPAHPAHRVPAVQRVKQGYWAQAAPRVPPGSLAQCLHH